MKDVKQVIVIRKDLHMRQGKACAQTAHASLKVILDLMNPRDFTHLAGESTQWILSMWKTEPVYQWLSGLFTKVVLYVNSEQELLDIYNNAKSKKILCSLIQDAGLTEFKGVPTYTCCAIGPDYEDVIDQITGKLPLL